ncbi:hypothetical protein H2204_003651 [Knufia peltigerae]|uniref:Uncharacterized protein n=1 Tax=Knufia peltigerae TaxID=1002370 RepID=A0AA38Y8M8_9EURO|nr:hypothetical protein H2204_003651 [Knufia peltigerae]
MRFTTAFATALLALTTPSVLAGGPGGGDWSSDTTTVTVTATMSTTQIVTKYLMYANATTSTTISHPTGWNSTAHTTASATDYNKPTLTVASSVASSVASGSPSIATATGAASAQEINLAVAALAGAAAMVWGSL